MSTSRPFAYNTGAGITGTDQVGSLAVGTPAVGFFATGLEWWNGPDEDLGYVIAQSVALDTQPTSLFNGAPLGQMSCSTIYKGVDINLSNNNQTASQQFGYQMSVLTNTFIDNNDKVMFSVLSTSSEPLTLPQSRFIGVGKTTMNYQGNPYGGYPGNDTQSIGFNAIGEYYYNGSVVQSGLPTWTSGDIIDIAISHGQYWWIRVNGGDWNSNPAANPATLTNGLSMNGLTNYYPALCPGYQGTMTIQNTATYGIPSGYTLLGTNVTASVGFFRSSALTDPSFISLSNTIAGPSGGGPFASGSAAKTWLNSNGYWTSYVGSTGATGGAYELVILPYNPPAAGDVIFPKFGVPGATSGTLDPNGFATGGVYWNPIDVNGVDQTSYYNGMIGNPVVASFTQNGNTAIYSAGPSGAFTFIPATGAFDASFAYNPQSSPGQLTLTQASPSNFVLGETVYISFTL